MENNHIFQLQFDISQKYQRQNGRYYIIIAIIILCQMVHVLQIKIVEIQYGRYYKYINHRFLTSKYSL